MVITRRITAWLQRYITLRRSLPFQFLLRFLHLLSLFILFVIPSLLFFFLFWLCSYHPLFTHFCLHIISHYSAFYLGFLIYFFHLFISPNTLFVILVFFLSFSLSLCHLPVSASLFSFRFFSYLVFFFLSHFSILICLRFLNLGTFITSFFSSLRSYFLPSFFFLFLFVSPFALTQLSQRLKKKKKKRSATLYPE